MDMNIGCPATAAAHSEPILDIIINKPTKDVSSPLYCLAINIISIIIFKYSYEYLLPNYLILFVIIVIFSLTSLYNKVIGYFSLFKLKDILKLKNR
jgi:hypothetical protein